MNGLIDGSHGVSNVRRATAVTMSLTPGMSSSVCWAGHRMGDIGQHVVQLANVDARLRAAEGGRIGGQRRSFRPGAGAGGSAGARTRTSSGTRLWASEGEFLGYTAIRKRNSATQEEEPYRTKPALHHLQ